MIDRQHFMFDCGGDTLVGTLDAGLRSTGLLIVSGGNEVRAGPWNSYAAMAADICRQGYPVMRFDRRGIGDSEGTNRGFRSAGLDIAAALGAFRAHAPHLEQVVGFGNCDGASALMLAAGAGFDALVLSNPWTIESESQCDIPAVARAHYRRRLTDLSAIRRLLTGGVSLKKLMAGLVAASKSGHAPSSLATELDESLRRFSGPVDFLIADRDRTAQAFLSNWSKTDQRISRCADASHSYVEPKAMEWLVARLIKALQRAES